MATMTQLQVLTHKRSIPMTFGLALGAGIVTLGLILTPGARQQTHMPAAQPAAVLTGAGLSLGTEYPDEAHNVAGWVPPTGAYAYVSPVPSVGDYEEAAPAITGWEPTHAAAASAATTGQYEDDAPNVLPWGPQYSASAAQPLKYGATVVEARGIGQAWVGPEAREMGADFETSVDGLRQYRSPRYNPFTGFIQADLMSRDTIEGEWVGHSHIEITGIYFDGE